MPIYYDAGNHVPGINSITKTATDLKLRDFLLSKNIQNPIKYPQLSTSPNGGPRGGEPVLDTMVGSGVIINQNSVEADGLLRYTIAVLPNRFINTNSSAPQLLQVDDVPTVPIFPTPNSGSVNYKEEDLDRYGLLAKSDSKKFREKSTLRNLYVDTVNQIDIADTISLQPIQTASQVKGGYLDEYGSLNLGQGGVTQAADILGSIINGQGVGLSLSSGGIAPVSNFDIRSSLAGRVLNAAGVIKDSKLGVIGAQQIALALGNNAAFNIQQQVLGKLNVQENIVSLIKGNGLAGFRPDFTITTPSSTGGQILSFAEKILGFNVPHSFLQPRGSLFTSESGIQDNISRANAMLENTGTGQIAALAKNINATLFGNGQGYDDPRTSVFRSGYAPGYKDHNGKLLFNPVSYAFMNADGTVYNFVGSVTDANPIPYISSDREKLVNDYGFTDTGDGYYSSSIKQSKATWTSNVGDTVNYVNAFNNQIVSPKKTLLGKTQKLFNSANMKTIVSTHGDMTILNGSQLQSSIAPGGGLSKGSGVLSGKKFNRDGSIDSTKQDAKNTFCRTWTNDDRYDSVNKLIRHAGLNKNNSGGSVLTNGWRQQIGGSVLEDTGFVQIAPYKQDNLTRSSTIPKKYMFSLENLAWAGSAAANLLPVEQGPGDLITGKFGRIMWFPPYDLTFSETSSVNIESTNFIGRGEPVYTYNNTERTGNLSFKMIIDHPSIMNAFEGTSGPTDEFIRSWFAGCVDLDSKWSDLLTPHEKLTVDVTRVQHTEKTTVAKPEMPTDLTIYFPNDRTEVDSIFGLAKSGDWYESGTGDGIGDYNGEQQKNCETCRPVSSPADPNAKWPDNTNYGLNGMLSPLKVGDKEFKYGWNDKQYIANLKNYLATPIKDGGCQECIVKIAGMASGQSVNGGAGDAAKYRNEQLSAKRAASLKKWMIDNLGLKEDRFTGNIATSTDKFNGYTKETSVDSLNVKKARKATAVFDVPPEKLVGPDKTVYEIQENRIDLNQSIRKRFYNEADFFDKIKQDDPFVFDKIREKIKFFHPSFHSMTPEGFNARLTFLLQCTRQGTTAIPNNDNVKNLAFGAPPVCILRVGDFYNTKIMIDNLSLNFEEQMWDLNPEGVGVQPMIATVSISFKYIGGSTLQGPINKLQNALSFNYFANAQVYDVRADYIDATKDGNDRNVTRQTNGAKKDNFHNEPGFNLHLGLDPTTQQMGDDNRTNTVNSKGEIILNQTKTSKAYDLNSYTQGYTDASRIELTNFSSSTITYDSGTTITFDISRVDPTDTIDLVQYYKVSVNITNQDDKTQSWDVPYFPNEYGYLPTTPYQFSFSGMTPPCTGFTSGDTYAFTVTLVGVEGGDSIVFDSIDIIPSEESNTSSGTVDKTPKLLGFSYVEIKSFANNSMGYAITIGLETENMFSFTDGTSILLISEDELNSFISDGVKISLDMVPTPLPSSRAEVIISTSGDFTSAVDNSYVLNDKNYLLDGNYMLTLTYDGDVVQRLPVIVSQTNQFKYSK